MAAIKRRILLVDDEPILLRALARSFSPFRAVWELKTASDAKEGLATLSADTFDVIISDMRMPGMDGAQLLEEVRSRFPAMVRLILSGDAGGDARMKALSCAHQFLSKPWDAVQLHQSLGRIFELRSKLNEETRAAASRITMLPSQLEMLERLRNAVADVKSGAKELASIIGEDVSLTVKLLQAVNSAFFAMPRRVVRVDEAIAYLGVVTVKSLAQQAHVLAAFGSSPQVEAVQKHSLHVANLARLMAPPEQRDDAFAAALLHDVGLLVLDTMGRSEADEGPEHGHVGAYLLHAWGIPWAVVEAVSTHHDLALDTEGPLSLGDWVGLAHVFAAEQNVNKKLLGTKRFAGRRADLDAWDRIANGIK